MKKHIKMEIIETFHILLKLNAYSRREWLSCNEESSFFDIQNLNFKWAGFTKELKAKFDRINTIINGVVER